MLNIHAILISLLILANITYNNKYALFLIQYLKKKKFNFYFLLRFLIFSIERRQKLKSPTYTKYGSAITPHKTVL